MVRNYFKLAIRTLAKHRTSTAINLLGLTLGVTACVVIYTITQYELGCDAFHPDRERIFRVVGQSKFSKSDEFKPLGFAPRAVPKAMREEIAGLETVASFHNADMPVTIPNGQAGPKRFERDNPGAGTAQMVVVDPAYFGIFRYEWLAGNPQTALFAPHTVVLSENKARLYFGDLPPEALLGKEVVYMDSLRTTVTGIVRDWTEHTDFTFTDFISLATIDASPLKRSINLEEWNDVWSASQLFVKLAPGTAPAEVQTQFEAFSKRHFGPDRGTGDFVFVPGLQALSDLHFNEAYQDNYTRKAHLPTLYGLMGVAVFILLLAAFNFINLTTAQSAQRGREIGMRKVLGSRRGSLIGQFMGETLLLTAAAVGISLALAPLALAAFKSFLPDGLRFSLLRPDLLLFLGGITLTTALLAGFYPAWVMSAHRPASSLKGQYAGSGPGKGRLRKGLIVFQFTFSLVFIIGSITVGRQLQFIREKDLGFSADAVVLINTLHDDNSRVLAQKIGQLAGVERVSMQWFAPMGENYMLTRMKYKGGAAEVELDVSAKVGDEQFIPLYDLRLVAGRNYTAGDTLRELVINEAFTRALGFRQAAGAIGQLLEFNGKNYPVSGVVADFHEQSFHRTIQPAFIAHLPQMSKNLGIKLASRGKSAQDIQTTLAQIRQQWDAVYPGKKFDYTFLDDSIAKLYERERKTARLVRAATAMAIFISCMGLFGLVTFMAERRTKEIGIRKVLGASVASVVALLSVDYLKLVFAALLLAAPLAYWALCKWLENFAYHIEMQGWVFLLAGLAAMGIALLTVGGQSMRAALANPVKSLKSE